MSTRKLLRAYQRLQIDDPSQSLARDLDLLQAKDLDLSVRLGALLAFGKGQFHEDQSKVFVPPFPVPNNPGPRNRLIVFLWP